jgi:hypothetical protein
MRRRLFTLLSVLSLALWVATCALWVRSYQCVDSLEMRPAWTPLTWWHVNSQYGSIECNVTFLTPTARDSDLLIDQSREGSKRLRLESAPLWRSGWDWFSQPDLRWRWLGFAYRSEDRGGPDYAANYIYQGVKCRGFAAPDWSLAFAAGLMPLGWLVTYRRRFRKGHCPSCGYDLRATPERCPECGTVPTAKKEIPN